MIKFFIILTMILSFAGTSYSQKTQPPVKYTIRAEKDKSADPTKAPIYTLTAVNAIRAVCEFAKIENFLISDEVTKMPGKNIPQLTSTNLEVLFQLVEKAFNLTVKKTTFEDSTVFYEFDKKK